MTDFLLMWFVMIRVSRPKRINNIYVWVDVILVVLCNTCFVEQCYSCHFMQYLFGWAICFAYLGFSEWWKDDLFYHEWIFVVINCYSYGKFLGFSILGNSGLLFSSCIPSLFPCRCQLYIKQPSPCFGLVILWLEELFWLAILILLLTW